MLFNNIKKLLLFLIAFHVFMLLYLFYEININRSDHSNNDNINFHLKLEKYLNNISIFCFIKIQTKNNIHNRLANTYENYVKYCDDYRYLIKNFYLLIFSINSLNLKLY